ncbi:hypothetical protein A3860_36040 [Niastella vici]|uniref:Uncharacterized protein n=1 Tax=Niastella vici TaxID=1703345 RepID=A0A1V9FMY7_9BACT|nr:hypothetical protein A3860_36040 [Niastella vici]
MILVIILFCSSDGTSFLTNPPEFVRIGIERNDGVNHINHFAITEESLSCFVIVLNSFLRLFV